MSEDAALALGAAAPNFTLLDQDGVSTALHDLAAKGPLVLVFYRGHW